MRYQDWKKEVTHHYEAFCALDKLHRYRINDEVIASVRITRQEPGFELRLLNAVQMHDVLISMLSHHDLIVLTNLHEALTRYVANDNPLREECELPDPAIWNRPQR